MRNLLYFCFTIALLLAPDAGHANCGNGNGNGNGCSGGQVGPQGPAGPQGPVGATGSTGISGANGRDASAETPVILGVAVRVASERLFDVDMFTDYDSTFGKVGFFGARIVFKPGESYEMRELRKLRKEIRDANAVMVPLE